MLYRTIIPVFDDSAEMWQDVQAVSVDTADFFITATRGQIDSLDARVEQCSAKTLHLANGNIGYYEIQLQSADYFAAGSIAHNGSSDGQIFIAWDTGTAIW